MQKTPKEIIAGLTLEEKASLCSGQDCWSTKAIAEHGIPSVRTCDGPSGLRFQSDADDHIGVHASVETVSFPTGAAMASSFDPELMERVGIAIGEESRSLGVGVVLGPAINIKRTPLCGRNFEYLSEDPYLTGEMAAAEIRGIQSQQVGACAKHFACNNQETWRMKIDAQLDERTLREIYLAGFETAVRKAQPCAIMASYNRVQGLPATENRHLLMDILRDDWGFEGFVVSDWGAANRRDREIEAGMDLEMPGSSGITDRQVVQAVKDGRLSEAALDKSAERILTQCMKYSHPPTGRDFDRERHHALAVEAATECAVLLKNDGEVLPLSPGQKVAFLGRFAQVPRFQGGGSASVNPFRLTCALDETADIEGITYAPAFPETGDPGNPQWEKEAVALAAQSDTAVIFAGLPAAYESECYDRVNLNLPACQNRLIEAVCKVQKNVVVVMYSGSAVEMPWIHHVQAVLQMHTAGQGTGTAAAALLYGKKNPCGKLSETYPLRLEDTPAYLNYPGDGNQVEYREGVFVGYRYYDKRDMPVLFPFGHGLSYTKFAYRDLTLSHKEMTDRDTLEVYVTVENVGNVSGKEVVQLYVGPWTAGTERLNVDAKANVFIPEIQGSVPRPVRELKGFRKIHLRPGESAVVTFCLDKRSFAWFNAGNSQWECTTGIYNVEAGGSSRNLPVRADILLHSTTQKQREPFSMNSLMSDISPEPELWSIVLARLSLASAKLKEIIEGEDENSCYLREELKELPMFGIRGIYSVPQEDLDALIAELNRKR